MGVSRHPDAAVEALARGAGVIGLDLSGDAISRFGVYLNTLLHWRARLSLTGASTASVVVGRHVLDSLQVVRLIESGARVADLGSGAGFPGIPVAIMCPRSAVSLIEARRKRANFLREVVRSTDLRNVEVIEGRAEALAPRCHGSFRIVASRAVWSLSEFLSIASPLLEIGGLAIAMKGPKGIGDSAGIGEDW